MTAVIMGSAVAMLAGLVQGCTGFGLALMAAPCLMLILPPKTAVPTLVLLSTLNTALVSWHARRHIRLAIVLPLSLGGVPGFRLGVYLLEVVDGNLLKAFVGIFVMLFALAMLTGWSHPLRHEKWARFPVGLLSGILGGSTSMGGPPAILFLANQNTPKDVFRANIVCYFLVCNCFGIAMYLSRGLLTSDILMFAATLVPFLLIGTFLGVWLSHRLDERQFRRLAMTAVAVMGLVLVVSSLAR